EPPVRRETGEDVLEASHSRRGDGRRKVLGGRHERLPPQAMSLGGREPSGGYLIIRGKREGEIPEEGRIARSRPHPLAPSPKGEGGNKRKKQSPSPLGEGLG